MAPLAQLRAALPDVLDVVADGVDARPNPAAIGFELGFAGAARADAAAQPRQRRAGADQPRQQILQLRELDLQLAFARPRAPREDVENELRAVDDLAADLVFDLPQLRGRQLVVEDDEVGARFGARGGERLDLAGAEKRRRIGLRPLLQNAQHDLGAGRLRQSGRARRAIAPPRAAAFDPATRPTSAARSRLRYARPSHACTSSHGIAPARTSRTSLPLTSTIVDGGPPRRRPGVEQQIDAVAQRPRDIVRDRRTPARR